jgi:anti-sigma factor ChrR (cupin superfamily)
VPPQLEVVASARPLVLRDLLTLTKRQEELNWEPMRPGVDIHWIYREEGEGAAAALIRFQAGGRVPLHEPRGHKHIFVLSGSQADENGSLTAGSLMIHPPGTRHSILSEEGCVVLAIYAGRVRFLDDASRATTDTDLAVRDGRLR